MRPDSFSVTAWGWGTKATGYVNEQSGATVGFLTTTVSYGYPIGGGLQSINPVVVVVK